jgi:hypothetical protein
MIVGSKLAAFVVMMYLTFASSFSAPLATQQSSPQSGSQTSKPKKRPPIPIKVTGQPHPMELGERRSRPAGGVRDPDLSFDLLAPVMGLALDAHPLFVWREMPDATSYTFTLTEVDEKTGVEKAIFDQETKAPTLKYPPNAPDLRPDRLYVWRVVCRTDRTEPSGDDLKAEAYFQLVPANERKEVEEALAALRKQITEEREQMLTEARLLRDYGYWFDTLQVCNEFIEKFPNDPEGYRLRGDIFDLLSPWLIKEHDADRSKADTLWRNQRSRLGQSLDRWAVVMGISQYQRLPKEQQLKFADVDAEAFYNFIRSPRGGGFPVGNIQRLLNEDAKTAAVRHYLGTWLPRNVKEGDIVYIYFAGHGMAEPFGAEKRAYFVTHDADPQDLNTTAVSGRGENLC